MEVFNSSSLTCAREVSLVYLSNQFRGAFAASEHKVRRCPHTPF